MTLVTDTNIEYTYDTDIHPLSNNRYAKPSTVTTAATNKLISEYKIKSTSISISCTPRFHSNVLMNQAILGYKVRDSDIFADISPRLIYDSNGYGSTVTQTGLDIPPTATGLYVTMWGAGGGGGGGAYESGGGYDGRGGGGGGSGQCIGFGLPVSTVFTYDFFVGMGGPPGLGGGSDTTYSTNTTIGGYGTGGGSTTFTYNGIRYYANGGQGGGRGRVNNSIETVDGTRGYGGTGYTKGAYVSGVGYNKAADITITDPNAKTDGNAGATNNGNSGGAGGAPVKFSRTASSFTSYNVTAVAGVGETGSGSLNQAASTFKQPIVADGMSKGGGGAGGSGDTSGDTGGFTGVPGSNGHIRIYAYFDNVPSRYV